MESIERTERRAQRAIVAGATIMIVFAGIAAIWSALVHLGPGFREQMPLFNMVVTWILVLLSLAGFGVLSFGFIELLVAGHREKHART